MGGNWGAETLYRKHFGIFLFIHDPYVLLFEGYSGRWGTQAEKRDGGNWHGKPSASTGTVPTAAGKFRGAEGL